MAALCSPSGRFAGGSRRQRPKEPRWGACSDLRLGWKLLSDALGNEALGERAGGRLLPRARPSRTRRREASPNHCAQRTRILEWVVDSSAGGSGIAIMRQSFALRRQRRLALATFHAKPPAALSPIQP